MAARTKRKVKNRSKAHRKHTKNERSRRIKPSGRGLER